MKRIIDLVQEKPVYGWLLFLSTVVIVFLVGLFGASIIERRSEARLSYQLIKPLKDWEPRNEVWGENFPREFETYIRTLDTMFHSKYGGNAMRDLLEEDPNNVILWAGFAFSRDYNQARGHYHSINDVRNSLRTDVPQPATCWTCKSTDVPRMMNQLGPATFYKKSFAEVGHEIVNSIGCQDCHDPKTMNLRISRPALAEAFQRRGKDITEATHQEMRSLVCAQCHVEYYFKGKEEKYLTFPWDNGFSADEMEAYYDKIEHVDFVHSLSKTPIVKSQHPDYELYMTGIHAERNVSCADCHMPYKSEGGVKFTNHQIMSPLANVANACQVCHRESEATLIKNVYDRQDRVKELLLMAGNALVRAHLETKFAMDKGVPEQDLQPIRKLIRHAQWRWDWVSSANGVGFHSPDVALRTLATSIQKSHEAHTEIVRSLAKRGYTDKIVLPDVSTKEKAQKYIGLDMAKLEAQKATFLKEVVPQWDAKAKERQGSLDKY